MSDTKTRKPSPVAEDTRRGNPKPRSVVVEERLERVNDLVWSLSGAGDELVEAEYTNRVVDLGRLYPGSPENPKEERWYICGHLDMPGSPARRFSMLAAKRRDVERWARIHGFAPWATLVSRDVRVFYIPEDDHEMA